LPKRPRSLILVGTVSRYVISAYSILKYLHSLLEYLLYNWKTPETPC
jgi:hypothetical protein